MKEYINNQIRGVMEAESVHPWECAWVYVEEEDQGGAEAYCRTLWPSCTITTGITERNNESVHYIRIFRNHE
jgi:hypothetical protein